VREAERMQELLRQAGVIVGLCGADHNVLKINPPLCVSVADIATLAAACDEALARL
jgi:4-aminobutyrate aminotransferase-like enzyme